MCITANCLFVGFCFSAFGGGFGRRGGLTSGFAGDGKKVRDSELGQRLHVPKWDLSRLQKFEKFFYHEHPAVANRSSVSYRHLSFFFLLALRFPMGPMRNPTSPNGLKMV